MSDRWIVILIGMVLFIMIAPIGCIEHQKNQCRIEAIKAGVEADKVNTACGIK